MNLLALQTAFSQHLLNGEAGIEAQVAHRHGVGIERRLEIYHRAYRMRLADALRDTFGHTARYLGSDWFDADALAFIEATPSSHPSLNDYGADLPDWLRKRHPQDPDIAELAMLDWTLRRAFDGPDAPVLALADLAAVPPQAWDTLGFSLHPTACQLVFTCNTLALWTALDRDEAPPPAAALAKPASLLVWRRGHQPHFRSLEAMESTALAALQAGTSFAGMCASLSEQFPATDVSVEAGMLLRRWVDEELLSAITAHAMLDG
jgi:hypothetical protein